MIRCHRAYLLARCHERGYTLDEVRPCIVSEDGDQITVDETHPAYPRAPKPGWTPAPQPAPAPDISLTRDQHDAPGFLAKVKNFAKSAANHIAHGMEMASDEEIIRRHDICLGCEFMRDDACTKCGCPLVRKKGYVSKLSWAHEKCPVGKW